MSSARLCDFPQDTPVETTDARQDDRPVADRRPANEMSRVLKTAPIHMALDPSGGAIAHWKHDPLHDVVEPMTDHVIMTSTGSIQRLRAADREDQLRSERRVPEW